MGFTDDRRYLWAGGLNDSKIYVFDVGSNPGQTQADKDHLRSVGQDGLCRTAYVLRDARSHADRHAVEHQRQRWRDRDSGLQQQGRVRRQVRHSHRHGRWRSGRWLWLRHCGESRQERHADIELHRARQLHARYRRTDQGRSRDEEVRQHNGAMGSEGDAAAADLQRAGRAARNPLVAESRRQLGDYGGRIDVEAVARQAGRRQVGRRRKSARSATRARFRCPWTSRSPPTARDSGSTPSWTE